MIESVPRVRRSRIRFLAMMVAGAAAAAATGATGRWLQAPAAGWAAAALVYVVWVWLVIGRRDPPGPAGNQGARHHGGPVPG